MDEAYKLQISTSIVLSNMHGIAWRHDLAQMALCNQFLTPPDTKQEPWGTGLKLLAGFSLDTCRNEVESNWSQIRQHKSSIEQSSSELALYTPSLDWRLIPFTHGINCLKFKASAVIFSTFFTYKASILFKLRICNLIFHSSYSPPAVRSHDSEQSYFSIFRKPSPSDWTTFTSSEWTTGKTSHSTNTAILSAVGSAGNTCFTLPSAVAQNEKLWSAKTCSSASPTYDAHLKKPTFTPGAAPTAVTISHTHWQKFHVLTTPPTWKPKIRLLMSILSQVHRYVMQLNEYYVWISN